MSPIGFALIIVKTCIQGRVGVRRRHTWRFASSAATHGSAAESSTPKAAMVVIGDEILAGSIADVNTPWLAKLLHRC
jgi:hypothetical protein